MTIEELKEVMSYFGAIGVGGMVGAGILYFVVKSYLPSYFAEKAKNLATREDIAEITRQIEGVKSEYAAQLQELQYQKTLLTEGFKNTLSKQSEFTRTLNGAVVELTKKLAAGSNVVSWLAWNATQPSPLLGQKDFESYETQTLVVLSDLVGLQAAVAALDATKFAALSPFAEELYERDVAVATAKPQALSTDPSRQQAGITSLAQIYRDSLDFDKRLLKHVTNLLRQ